MGEDLATSIGRTAREHRRALKLTQADVAERAGLSVEFYARIERGHALPSVQTLVVLMRLLGLSFDELVTDEHEDGAASGAPSDASTRSARVREPQDFYDLGSPEQRRIYRRLRDATPPLLKLVAETIVSFEQAVEEATRTTRVTSARERRPRR
jgi:transcriptional regulator with XRE-family HTH domain